MAGGGEVPDHRDRFVGKVEGAGVVLDVPGGGVPEMPGTLS